jgi:hypothetical protein
MVRVAVGSTGGKSTATFGETWDGYRHLILPRESFVGDVDWEDVQYIIITFNRVGVGLRYVDLVEYDTMTTATIKAAILALMDGGVGLTDIKKWFKAEPPPNKYTGLFGFVEWTGGAIVPEASQKRVQDDFRVVIAKKGTDIDANEDAVIAYAMAAEALIDAGNTLGGTTFDSWVSMREIAKYPPIGPQDYELCAVQLTVTTWRYKA